MLYVCMYVNKPFSLPRNVLFIRGFHAIRTKIVTSGTCDGLFLIPSQLHRIPGALLLTWMCNHIPTKVWDEVTYSFLNFNGSTLYNGCNQSSMLGLKLIHVSKGGHSYVNITLMTGWQNIYQISHS